MNNQRIAKVVDVVSFIFALISTVFLPIFLDKTLVNYYIIPKQYVLGATALLMLLLWAVKTVLTRHLFFKRSILDRYILIFLGFGLISSFFSVSIYDSFGGRGEYFVLNFVFSLFLALFYSMLVNQINSKKRWDLLVNVLVATGILSALVFLTKSIFNPSWLSALVGGSVWNTIDQSNSVFGFWLAAIFMLSAGKLIKKNLSVGSFVLDFLAALASFACLLFLGFSFLWWVILCVTILLLFFGVIFIKEARLWWVSTIFAVLVLSTIFVIFGSPKFLKANVPPEISLGVKPSWTITSNTVLSGFKNFLIGTGPGTFNIDFSRFRTTDFNNDSLAWSLRFNQPFNSFFALLAEGGVLVSVAFVFLILFVLGNVFFAWYKTRAGLLFTNLGDNFLPLGNDVRFDVFLVAIVWLFVSGGMFAVCYGPTMWWLWWFLLALVVVGMSFLSPNIIQTKEWRIEDSPQYSLSFSFLMIVLMAAIIMTAIWGVRLYTAEKFFAAAISSQNVKQAQNNLLSAVERRGKSDSYHALLAQAYLVEATNLAQTEKPDAQKVSALIAEAVNEAKLATEISPNSVSIWANLATMYENASALVAEARDWAVKSLIKARELEPSNAVLAWRLGNDYNLLNKTEEAVKNYQEAIDLKPDYTNAYISLAGVYEKTQEVDKAVDLLRQSLTRNPGQVDILYHYGRLLYNRNAGADRTEAEKVWLRTVEIEPKYSNALYSLGLLYEGKGDKAAALRYYNKVREINPENKDVIAKIKSLTTVAPEK